MMMLHSEVFLFLFHLCPLLQVSSFGFQHVIEESNFSKLDVPPISKPNPSETIREKMNCKIVGKGMQERFRIRRARKRRNPPNYWSGLDRIRAELILFWEETLQIPILGDERDTPPIPNEMLLSFTNRHDLKYAINSVYSGRETLAYALSVDSNRKTPSRIIGGRWYADDCINTREVQLLYQHAILGPELQKTKPYARPTAVSPASPTDEIQDNSILTTNKDLTTSSLRQISVPSSPPDKWRHRPGRNTWGFWNSTTVERELFEFLDTYNTNRNRPRIWAPRLSEFTKCNRSDLHMALVRFHSTYENLCKTYHLIPHREWSYFDSVYQLLSQLYAYYNPGKGNVTGNEELKYFWQTSSDHVVIDNRGLIFPEVLELKSSHPKLYELIQRHGGRKNVAKRFGIALSNTAEDRPKYYAGNLLDYNYGPFSLTFALLLMTWVRHTMMKMEPIASKNIVPTSSHGVEIRIPNQQELLRDAECDGKFIHDRIVLYGGYENVARRLGLVW